MSPACLAGSSVIHPSNTMISLYQGCAYENCGSLQILIDDIDECLWKYVKLSDIVITGDTLIPSFWHAHVYNQPEVGQEEWFKYYN